MKQFISGLLALGLAVALISSCGAENVGGREPQVGPSPAPSPNPDPNCDSSASKVTLALFARTDCAPCAVELPDLNNRIKTQLADKTCRIKAVVYMTDGNADQAMANEYGKKLGIDFTMGVDQYCRAEYKKYYTGNCVLPSAALLSENGEVIKVYPKAKVDLDDLMAQMKQRLN